MRDPKRIKPMIELLESAWNKNPDLRLGQLVVILNGGADPFNVEDDKTLEQLKKLVSPPSQPNNTSAEIREEYDPLTGRN